MGMANCIFDLWNFWFMNLQEDDPQPLKFGAVQFS